MTVKELMRLLSAYDPDTVVSLAHPDSGWGEDITGIIPAIGPDHANRGIKIISWDQHDGAIARPPQEPTL
jgi:hypothetical protein